MVISPCAFTLHRETGNSGRHLSSLKVSKYSIEITVKLASALHASELMEMAAENAGGHLLHIKISSSYPDAL